MEKSLKHFVRRILGIHLLLLAVLLTVVSAAARHVYNSARDQAVDQARVRQTLLAEQTAHGIATFYDSILGDLNLLKPDDEEVSDLPDLPQQTGESHPLPTLNIVRQAVGAMLVQQLKGRAELFLVDEQMHPHMLGEERPLKSMVNGVRSGRPKVLPAPPTTAPTNLFEQDIIEKYGSWLRSLKEPKVSDLESIGEHSIKLISVPLFYSVRVGTGLHAPTINRRSGWLVAVVSAKPIEKNFLGDLSIHDISGAFLVDQSGVIMAASRHALVGADLDHDADPELTQALKEFDPAKASATRLLLNPFKIGPEQFQASMISACPLPLRVIDQRWFVLVTSPMQDVDKVVRDLAKQALIWTIVVALSMTGILVSTAAQLIFSRMKMERVRHQTLQNEMRQARQIQLAWLPQKTKATAGGNRLDIASLNRPATHISGDFYNFFDLPDGRTAIVIGDVTGHGTAAAFLMATTQLLLRNALPQFCDPGKSLQQVNSQLTNQVFNGQFVTMQVIVIDTRTGEMEIATAGHPAPLITEDNREFQSLEIEPQLVAGIDPLTDYPTERFQLQPGTSILLYTDGAVETADPSGNLLKTEGLRLALTGPVENAEALLHKAVSAVNTFRRGEELHDDLTFVAIHLLPSAWATPPHTHRTAPVQAVGQLG